MTKNKQKGKNLGSKNNTQPTKTLDLWLDDLGKTDVQLLENASEASRDVSTTEQISRMNKQMMEFQKNMLEKFSQLALTVDPNHARTGEAHRPNPIATTRTQGLAQATQHGTIEPTIEQILTVIHEGNVQNRFMQASAMLKPLRGNEGRTQVEDYFRHFENITYSWSDMRRAALLATHLEGNARLTYDTLSDRDRQSYEILKEHIIQRYASTNAIRTRAQYEVLRGIRVYAERDERGYRVRTESVQSTEIMGSIGKSQQY